MEMTKAIRRSAGRAVQSAAHAIEYVIKSRGIKPAFRAGAAWVYDDAPSKKYSKLWSESARIESETVQ